MNRREMILRAAAEEFAEKGYAATTFGSIGARVGMHRNALQHYISSKPELAAEIAWHPFRNGRFLEPDAPLTGGIRMLYRVAEYAAEQYVTDVFSRASTRLMLERDRVPADLPVLYQGWVEPITVLLREAVAAGDVDENVDVDDLAWRLIAAFTGLRVMSEALDELDRLPQRVARTAEDLLRANAPS
jgi:AcrR family transcriptional regulator